MQSQCLYRQPTCDEDPYPCDLVSCSHSGDDTNTAYPSVLLCAQDYLTNNDCVNHSRSQLRDVERNFGIRKNVRIYVFNFLKTGLSKNYEKCLLRVQSGSWGDNSPLYLFQFTHRSTRLQQVIKCFLFSLQFLKLTVNLTKVLSLLIMLRPSHTEGLFNYKNETSCARGRPLSRLRGVIKFATCDAASELLMPLFTKQKMRKINIILKISLWRIII